MSYRQDGDRLALDGFMNRQSGATRRLRELLGLAPGGTVEHAVDQLRTSGWVVKTDLLGDQARSTYIVAETYVPIARRWADMLGLDMANEFEQLVRAPQDGRAIELACLVRDHVDGGVDALIEVINEVIPLFGLVPKKREDLATAIVALGQSKPWCFACDSNRGPDPETNACLNCGAV